MTTTTSTRLSNDTASVPKSHEAIKAIEDVAFGSIAGAIGKILEYPFDTLKVRLQSSPPSLYPSAWSCFTTSLREGGLPSLYRGISAPLVGAAIETSSLFWSYRVALQGISSGIYGDGSSIAVPGNLPALERELPLSAKFAAGAASGAFTSLMLTPIELVKCQMQVPSLTTTAPLSAIARYPQQKPPHALAIIASVFRHRGILGFWHGQLGTLIRETGGSAAWFGSYEGVSEAFYKYEDSRRRKNGDALASASASASTSAPIPAAVTLPIWQQLIAGAIAGMSYNFIFFPADTIKSRMQTAEVEVEVDSRSTSSHQTTSRTNNNSSIGARAKILQTRKTFWKVGRDIWAQQGIRGMYRGCGITVARAAPSSAFIFLVFEELKGRFGS